MINIKVKIGDRYPFKLYTPAGVLEMDEGEMHQLESSLIEAMRVLRLAGDSALPREVFIDE